MSHLETYLINIVVTMEPEITHFGLDDTEASRKEKINNMNGLDRERLRQMIQQKVEEEYYKFETDPSLYDLMDINRPTELVISDDWNVRIYRTTKGILYDWNGWPGDNECGTGVFYSNDGTVVKIFDNSDQCLQPQPGARFNSFTDVYEKIRLL